MKYAHVDDKNAGTDNPLGDYPQQFRSHLERGALQPSENHSIRRRHWCPEPIPEQSNVATKDLDEDRAIKLLMQSDRSLHWKKKTVFIVQSFVRFLQGVGVARPMLPAAANDAARGRLRQEYEEYLRCQ